MEVSIRKLVEGDFEAIWPIFKKVIEKGDSYVFLPNSSRDIAYNYWLGPEIKSYIAEWDGEIVGMYKLVENQPGLGAHVANASFMVDPSCQGKGIGRLMGQHCLEEARKLGFKAMQFNFVISTNYGAIKLWKDLGFEIVGRLPRAFRHLKLGYVDAYIMFKNFEGNN